MSPSATALHPPPGRHFPRIQRLFPAALVILIVGHAAADIVPTDGMVITENTTLVPGTYNLPNGVSIGASGITLDLNGAELVGTAFFQFGVSCIGHDNVTIQNGIIRGYYYGIRVENAAGVEILGNNLSGNWLDPNSLEAPAPFLNINAGPNLTDRTNLGGGLFMKQVVGGVVSGNTMRSQENGIDLYFVTSSTVSGNDCSANTGWGIHLYDSDDNLISGNTADDCTRPGLGDSAGVLLVYDSSGNQLLSNSFQGGGDGFFIGNEHGCPSDNNLVQGNNGSYAGANAFEATFSAGNHFIDNIADGSNYGFWLGYSHSGNVIRGNSIRGNNTNGIEIEHGQHNTIEGNDIIGNGGRGIVLRTDGAMHFPQQSFPCLELPDQANSSHYTIRDNVIHSNFGLGLELINTTDSQITNNLVAGNLGGGTATSNGGNNTWSIEPTAGENIVGGPTLGGNYWSNYTGEDLDADGLGDTDVPYTNGGSIALPGDPHPLIGNPQFGELANPRSLCDRGWIDLGRNTRSTGGVFDTSNGTHFATDGSELYLLESTNSNRLSRLNPVTSRYELQANLPQTVWDGGDLQFGDGAYYATVGVAFDNATGGNKGSYLYAYDADLNTWSTRARTLIDEHYYANEALAYDSVNNLFYATIVFVQNGGDTTATRRLAVYDPDLDTWTGVTAATDEVIQPGSEAEYLDGRIYVWRGSLAGGAVSGSDSYLNVYDIATDSWSRTPTLQASGVVPGFRTGGFDIWAPGLSADAANNRLFVMGAEVNRQLYVFDVSTQTWTVGPAAIYDGGWGASFEYVPASQRLYQIDGRTSLGNPQGTAVMVVAPADGDLDGDIDLDDHAQFFDCLSGPEGPTPDGCHRFDLDCDNDVDGQDFAGVQVLFTGM